MKFLISLDLATNLFVQRTLYKNWNSSVKLLHFGTTQGFSVSRCVKQGDPISPFLFLLVMKVGNVGPTFNADSELKEKKTYLGIKICKDQKERINLNYSPLWKKKIQKKFNSWLMRDLSLNGRVLLSNQKI